MPSRLRSFGRPAAFAALATVALLLAAPAAAEVTRPLRAALTPATGATLELENLAGSLRVEPSTGTELVIEGTVHAESDALADVLHLELTPTGDRLVAKLTYPLDEHRRYVYPRKGDGGFLSGLAQSNGKFQGREVTVYSGSRSGAVLLYCDLTVKLPAGHGAKLRNMAGDIAAERVQADLRLDTGSGDIAARDNRGALAADTGSGDVSVERHRGGVAVDTGSGDVTLADVEGSVAVDTGSGSIAGRDLRGDSVACDTGSGDVRLERVAAALTLDTGSGSIIGRALEASGKVVADTGSGDVRLAGDFSRVQSLVADTGSGDVILEPSGAFPALRVEVSTGSGDIDVDVAGLTVERSKRGDFRGRVGDGAVGLARIDTGSGDVVLRAAAR